MEEDLSCSSSIPEPIYNWQDITQEFMDAASELQLGELMHDGVFGLFEAMSAIEMMDPKMDAGMLCNQTKRKVLNFEQSIEAGAVKIENITLAEHIGIMDSTLACLVTWLEGHSLAQTVFTNLYLHDPDLIKDKCMRAFSVCMLKIVDIIRDRINRASVFEEEDFQPMTYGFKMAPDYTDVKTMSLVKEVEDDLHRVIKTTRSKQGESRDTKTEMEHELSLAVYSRLKFCRLFFSTLVAFSKEKCQGLPDVERFSSQMNELIPTLKKTVKLGIQTTEDATSNDSPLIMGFEPLVNQRLLPPTFPRYTRIKTREESIVYLEELVADFKHICSITEINQIHTALEFFHEFSKKYPSVLSRSLLQLCYISQNRRVYGTQLMTDVLRDMIRGMLSPPVLMPKSPIVNNPQAKEYVDVFLTHAVRPLCSIFQITGHNRARQRDKWGNVLEELASLQEEADKVDTYLHGLMMKVDNSRSHLSCFGTFVLYHTLQAMIHFTIAGFELELYAPHEYHYVFWYLYEFLYNWFITTISRADNYSTEQQEALDQKGRSNKKTKKKKKTKTSVQQQVYLYQGQQNLCAGYYKAIVGFQLDGKAELPDVEFDSEEVRYRHRFAPFGSVITPLPVGYAQFKDMTDLRRLEVPPSPTDMYSLACKHFQTAKTLFENIINPNEEVQNLIKVAKTNFVVMKLLAGGHKKDSQVPPQWEFKTHKIFPVVKIV